MTSFCEAKGRLKDYFLASWGERFVLRPTWQTTMEEPDEDANLGTRSCSPCTQLITCCSMCPKQKDADVKRPKCCGVKTTFCVQLLSLFVVLAGILMTSSTLLSFNEPCDVPLAQLMLAISILFICFGLLFCCLPEKWYRCGSLTVTATILWWLIPANYCKC